VVRLRISALLGWPVFMKLSRPLLSVSLAAALVAATAVRVAEAQPVATGDDGAYRGYLAVRVLGGGELEVVDALNADRLFVPASVLKVVTVAATLDRLGPDYRWLTRLTADGGVNAGVLEGDLVIEPGGDPTWSKAFFDGGAAEPLAALAQQLRARGLREVTGDLVVDTSRFPGRPHPTDRGFADLPYEYGTPTASLAVDDATVTVRVAPGAVVGGPARVTAPAGVDVLNHTVTVGRERGGAGTLDFIPVWGTDTLLLRGEYPINEPPFVVSASDPAPALRAARRLRDVLGNVGVTIAGGVRFRRRVAAEVNQGQMTVLAEFRSAPLRNLLSRVLTRSHNWSADMLTLTLAREVTGTGRFDDGVDVIADFVRGLGTNANRDALGTPQLSIVDGSGLSSLNLVTPATLVQVLAHAVEQRWGQILLDALARLGEGTLAAWPSLPPVAAKTGTLRHTVALAGVLNAESATPGLFCYFVNHHLERPVQARREITAAVARWRGTVAP